MLLGTLGWSKSQKGCSPTKKTLNKLNKERNKASNSVNSFARFLLPSQQLLDPTDRRFAGQLVLLTLLVGDIIDHDNAMSTAVVAAGDGPEPLLSGGTGEEAGTGTQKPKKGSCLVCQINDRGWHERKTNGPEKPHTLPCDPMFSNGCGSKSG